MTERMVLAVLLPLLLLCACIGVMVAAYLWLFWYVFFHYQQRQRSLEDNSKPPELQGLSEADLLRMPTIECGKEEGGDERIPRVGEDQCAVCLELFEIGDQCRVIPVCRHAFHVHCADAWLSKRAVCPLCRRSARESEREEEKVVIIDINVNGGATQEDEVRDEESERSSPPATAETVVVLNAYRDI